MSQNLSQRQLQIVLLWFPAGTIWHKLKSLRCSILVRGSIMSSLPREVCAMLILSRSTAEPCTAFPSCTTSFRDPPVCPLCSGTPGLYPYPAPRPAVSAPFSTPDGRSAGLRGGPGCSARDRDHPAGLCSLHPDVCTPAATTGHSPGSGKFVSAERLHLPERASSFRTRRGDHRRR